jgi:hypothetical protein
MLRAIFTSLQGWSGTIVTLLVVLWRALEIWQTEDFLPSHMTWLADFLNSLRGTLVLVVIRFFFMYRAISARWSEIPQPESHEQQRTQDEAVNAYFDQMHQWLNDEGNSLLKAPPEDQRRKMARTLTLTTLERVGPKHKRRVLQFLQEHDLIRPDTLVVFLGEADFSGAQLANMNLVSTYLVSANLSGANLSGAS